MIKGDKRLLEAHKKAVKCTLDFIEEEFIGTRSGSKKSRRFEFTNNLTGALFHHGTSRMKDPQLHTHSVIMNTTRDTSDRWKAIHNDDIYKNSVLFGVYYQKKLADLAMELGYEIAKKENLYLGNAPDTFLGGGGQLSRQLLDVGEIGDVKLGNFIFAFPGVQSWHPNPEPWFQQEGGPAIDMGPYFFTTLVNFLGPK